MKLKLKNTLVLSSAFLCALAYGQNAAPSEVKIAGSDIVGPVLKAAAESSLKEAGIKASFSLEGSFPALAALKDGKADIAIIGVPKGKAKPEGYMVLPVCYQAAVVIVNPLNPIMEISTGQLAQVFGKSPKTRIESWTALSSAGGGLKTIQPVMTAFGDNVVIELFKYSCMPSDNLGPWVNVMQSPQDVFATVKTNTSVLAVVGKADDASMIKVLSVSSSREGEDLYAFKPNSETIHNGDYPMTLAFYLVFKKENLKKVKPAISALLSDEASKNVDAGAFYSVPKNLRKRLILELDIAE